MDGSSSSPSPPIINRINQLMVKNFKKKEQTKKVFVNQGIRATEVRLVDSRGEQLGVVSLDEAIAKAKEEGLDLIQVTDKIDPPVAKIADYGKYVYNLQKKERAAHHHKGGELKRIRLTFNISDHDLETRARSAEKFLKIGDKVMIEMRLKGREKAHADLAKEKIERFINSINEVIPVKTERDIKKQPRGFTTIITRQ